MEYSEEFVKKVLDEYRDLPGYLSSLKEAFAVGNDGVIYTLLEAGKSLNMNINVERMLEAVEAQDNAFLKAVLEKCRLRQKLYEEWQTRKIKSLLPS